MAAHLRSPTMILRSLPLLAALLLPLSAQAHQVDPLKAAPTAPAPNAARESVAGTVHELVIDDRVAQMSVRYVTLVPQSGAAVALSGAAVDGLADGATAEVVGRRNGAVLFVDSARTVAAGAKAAAATTSVEGDLAVAHADDFETGRSEYLYEVHEQGGRVTRLKLAVRPEALQAGMHLAVHGRRDAASDELDPARIEVLALPDTTAGTTTTASTSTTVTAKAATTHSVLVIPVKFSDTASDPLPITSVQNVMTTASNSVANFFREVSYGQHVLNVTVPSQWVRSATMATPSTCNYTAIASAGDAAATAAGYTVTNYQFRVYIFPRVSACGWSGLAYIGSPKQAWINGPASVVTQVIGHEMGHNFGLLHAASLDCGAQVTGGTCTASEYGDPFNTMGNSRAMHYDSTQKSLLGWIPSTSVQTHSSGSASYTLSPLEVAGGSTYAIKIPAATNRTYWLEYRQPIGFDAPLASYPNNGAQLRVASPFETQCSGCGAYSDDTQFIDLTPATTAFTDGTLVAGSSFTDTQYGITINVISATASALTVQVSGPGSSTSTTPAATTTTVASSSNPVAAGSSVTFTATVNGTAPTGTVAYTDNGASLAGCTAVALAGSGNARTAACTASLAAGSHTIVARYSGDTANAASSSASFAETVSSTTTTGINVALASAGGVATASSTYSTSFPASAVNNGDHKGSTMGRWKDGTGGSFPDWVQVAFAGSKTISRVVVYSVQDNYTNPVEPTDTMTFSLYGLKSFQVQGWSGSAWVTLASVTGNNLVKRTVTFAPYTTTKIRVYVTAAADGWSRATEVEAWTN